MAAHFSMGNWYRVTKRINGRLYDYWQRTYRAGKAVKTENRYIGPAGPATAPVRVYRMPPELPPSPEYLERMARETRRWLQELDAERREDERIQYGPLQARLKRQAAKTAAAKKNARGKKYLNVFLGQAIKQKAK